MGYSVITQTGTGATNQFTVNFALGYFTLDDVTCQVNNETDGGGNPLYRTITAITDTLFQISGAAPALGVPVVFTRTVDPTTLKVDWQNDAIIDEENLNNAQKQALYLVHQFLDGRNATFAQDLDLGMHRIINLSDPIDDNDAANKAWVIAQPSTNIQAAIDAKEAAENAAADADAALTAANAAVVSANAAAAAAAASAASVGGLAFLKANLLSEIAAPDRATARGNLGLGTASTLAQATSTQIRQSANAAIAADVLATAAVYQTLATTGTITIDVGSGWNAIAGPLTGNVTFANPTTTYLKPGMGGVLLIKQPASGGPYTASWGSNWKFFNGTPVLSTAANAVDMVVYVVEDTSTIRAVLVKP